MILYIQHIIICYYINKAAPIKVGIIFNTQYFVIIASIISSAYLIPVPGNLKPPYSIKGPCNLIAGPFDNIICW